MAISKVQAMRPALNDVIDLVNELVDFEPYITNAVDEWLDEHPEATTTVEDGSITYVKLAASLVDWLMSKYDERTPYDAFAPMFAAGAALGITGNVTESAEWLQRVTTSDGPTTIRSIHGRTLRWNQLANCTFTTARGTDGVTLTNNGDGSLTIDGTSTLQSGYKTIEMCDIDYVANHKVLIKTGLASSASSFVNVSGLGRDYGSGNIFTSATSATMHMRITFGVGSTFSNVTFWPQLFDLTAMFGSGNEPSTVAEFEALYPKRYYPYDAVSLLPVNMTGIESVGWNLLDPAKVAALSGVTEAAGVFSGSSAAFRTAMSSGWEGVDYIPGKQYEMSFKVEATASGVNARPYVFYTDGTISDGTVADSSGIAKCVSSAGKTVDHFGMSYSNTGNISISQPCINLSDPSRNGTYEPYWSAQRLIPVGTLRSAGSVYDEQTATERITRVGERAYQSGDESDPTVTTDGTITYYPLTTPTTTPIDPPLNMSYRTAAGGTERVMVPTGENSAPPTIVAAQGYTAESLLDTIAPIEGNTASENYAVDSYLIHDGKLCLVVSSIAIGEPIVIGQNVTATTVMKELVRLTQ